MIGQGDIGTGLIELLLNDVGRIVLGAVNHSCFKAEYSSGHATGVG